MNSGYSGCFMNIKLHTVLIVSALALSACATHSSSTVTAPGAEKPSTLDEQKTVESDRAATDPKAIILTKDDIGDRPYEVIGDITVTVNKTTLFHPDPTPALVDEELREEAAELGADAVILVRYGTVGVSVLSWGSLDGQGRAIFFTK